MRTLRALGLSSALALGCSVAALVVGGGDDAQARAASSSASRCAVPASALGGQTRAVVRRGTSVRARRRTSVQAKRRAGARARARTTPAIVAIGAQGRPATGPVTMRVALGSDRGVVVRRQAFRLVSVRAGAVRAIAVNDFLTADGERTMPIGQRQLVTWVEPLATDPALVQVVVCYDPRQPTAIDAGTYSGGLMVLAGAAAPVPLGLTISARDTSPVPAVLAALLGLVAGIFVRIGADRRWGPIEVDWTYVLNFRFWVMIGGGVAAAVYSYLTLYAADPVFDVSVASLWQLSAQTFAGTLASKAATDLIGPTGREIKGNKARKQTLLDPADSAVAGAQGGDV
ncbi:hypothetical protein Q5424_09730 [Conexibacter sp. JD483]|uniref:hypothetical protein n=1 Tax=unclassified Conexibacter TaxID=2627773 RepID=UPI002715B74F|nr:MULTISPECIES: hypothetical protein [unclassified Conexibacter]MDO8185426.1 hypothetical protein [Conexibacter sp. CPCC 205706]MDO8198398.1 hypothetical protein [Conexibacter sp. CPCC 205762]MDR9369360.1 hypothetical protein [Conexibacter sp. JD483]